MPDVNVLVVFYSRHGDAEKLALAAGVGAIQQKGSIRLRRIADDADETAIASDPAWQQNRARMNRDYIAPREVDVAWADVLILASSTHSPGEMLSFVRQCGASRSVTGKLAAPLAPSDDETVIKALCAEAAWAGLIVVPAVGEASDAIGRARAHGSYATSLAGALKTAQRQ
jgi:hypothetical protein